MAVDQPKSATNKDGYSVDDLVALVERGPVWDGDVPSKSGRDELIQQGYAIRVVHKGEDGYTAASIKGRDLYCKHFGGDTISQAKARRIALRDQLRIG